jgi:folate-binding protein YgfZ
MFVRIDFLGKKVRSFLHNYTITNCLHSTQKGNNIPTAFLNKKGRVLATALLIELNDEKSRILLPEETCQLLIEHLAPYAKFSRITMVTHLDIILESSYCDPNVLCSLPMPWLKKKFSGCFTVSDLSLDLLGWVDRDKGCYLGQEIVSRLYFKQKERKKFLAIFQYQHYKDLSILPDGCIIKSGLTLGVIDENLKHSLVPVKTYQFVDNTQTE